MKFTIFGILIGFFTTLPYIVAYCNGIWSFGIPRLFYITNIKTAEQGVILVFDKRSHQFKLDIAWDNFTFVLKTGYFDINLFIPWVQLLLGEKKTQVILEEASGESFLTKHGNMTVYKACGHMYYNYFRFIKFNKTAGWTYHLIDNSGKVTDRREHLCITNRNKAKTYAEASLFLEEFIDIMHGMCEELNGLSATINKIGDEHV